MIFLENGLAQDRGRVRYLAARLLPSYDEATVQLLERDSPGSPHTTVQELLAPGPDHQRLRP
jgi:hypothetical protein